MLSYVQLKSFVVLCSTGSFSTAASQMETNQSAITKRIQQIEGHLGKVLLRRQSNGREVFLTEEGKVFLLHADNVVKSYEALNSIYIAKETSVASISIGAVKSFFHLSLTERAKKLANIYPKLNMNLEIRGTDELIYALKDGEIDIVFVVGDYSNSIIESKYIVHYDFGWYVSTELYEKIKKLDSIEQIFADYSVMLCKQNTFPIALVTNVIRNNNISDFNIHTSDSIQTMIDLVNQGIGLGFLPKKFAEWDNERRVDKLHELPLPTTEGISIYSAILKKNIDKKKYYDFITGGF